MLTGRAPKSQQTAETAKLLTCRAPKSQQTAERAKLLTSIHIKKILENHKSKA